MRRYDDPQVKRLSIKASGCPNSCGHHWIGDIGFYGNARKIDGKEVPYYQMLLGGGYDEEGIMRFGLAVQSIPARLAPEAVTRVLDHFLAHRLEGESFRQYVLRHKVETFRALTRESRQARRAVPRNLPGLGRRARPSRCNSAAASARRNKLSAISFSRLAQKIEVASVLGNQDDRPPCGSKLIAEG